MGGQLEAFPVSNDQFNLLDWRIDPGATWIVEWIGTERYTVHRKIESCCSVVLFAFFLRFPAPSSLVQIRLRIKTKQDATLAQVAAQQPLVSNKASSNSFFGFSYDTMHDKTLSSLI